MDIPKNILVQAIQDSLSSQKLYLFKNTSYDGNAPVHYHFAIKTNDSNYIMLTMLTSQVEKKKSYYSNSQKSLSSLIEISASEISQISNKLCLDSCIDCNNPIVQTHEELQAKIDIESFKYIEANISKELIDRIIMAIKNSPQVRPYIKNLLNVYKTSHSNSYAVGEVNR